MTCTLTPRPDGLVLQSPYDPAFVAAFKALLSSKERTWDAARKVWVIDPGQANAVADLCQTFFGQRPDVPTFRAAPTAPEVRAITLEYLGATKLREDGSKTAMGYSNGSWSVIISEAVLKAWYGHQDQAAKEEVEATYYTILGVKDSADVQEIKAGYKRMARHAHPDVNKEPDAHEQFLRLQQAYNVLSDPLKRKKYDAGRFFEAQNVSQRDRRPLFADLFRSPLRCGLLVAEVLPKLGRYEVTKIFQWNEIIDGAGRVMVSSWSVERERIVVSWVTP